MYKLIGEDGRHYGPISAERLREWIAQGRADHRTLVRREDIESVGWKPLTEFPEFGAALATVPLRPPGATRLAPPPMPVTGASPTTSGLAIASFILAFLGVLLLPALISIGCGIAALGQIRRSAGRLTGRWLAVTGIILSSITVVVLAGTVVFIVSQMKRNQGPWGGNPYQPASVPADQGGRVRAVPMTTPAPAPAPAMAPGTPATMSPQLRSQQFNQWHSALQAYRRQNNGRYPHATNWCDLLLPFVVDRSAFRLTAQGRPVTAVGYNPLLGGRDSAQGRRALVVFFEIQEPGWNLHGGPALTRFPEWEGERFMVSFSDGSVRNLPSAQINTLRWEP